MNVAPPQTCQVKVISAQRNGLNFALRVSKKRRAPLRIWLIPIHVCWPFQMPHLWIIPTKKVRHAPFTIWCVVYVFHAQLHIFNQLPLHLETKSIEFLMPSKTKHTLETLMAPGIRFWSQFGAPWQPPTSPWSTWSRIVLFVNRISNQTDLEQTFCLSVLLSFNLCPNFGALFLIRQTTKEAAADKNNKANVIRVKFWLPWGTKLTAESDSWRH